MKTLKSLVATHWIRHKHQGDSGPQQDPGQATTTSYLQDRNLAQQKGEISFDPSTASKPEAARIELTPAPPT